MAPHVRSRLEPVALLVSVGFLLAVNVNLAKAGITAGASALELAFWLHAGAGVILLGAALALRQGPSLKPLYLANYGTSGLISFAFPGVLGFAVAGNVGPAYGSIIYALSPLITYALAIALRLDRPALIRSLGLTAGLVGTAIVVAGRFGIGTGDEGHWVLLALIVPVSLAFGNVIRTALWPAGASGLALAPGSLLTAGLLLLPAAILVPDTFHWPSFSDPAGQVISAQIAVATLFYALYFRLQKTTGPVYLSQIGYVATGFGVAIAVVAFGDTVSGPMLAGIAMIVGGVALVSRNRNAADLRPRPSAVPQTARGG